LIFWKEASGEDGTWAAGIVGRIFSQGGENFFSEKKKGRISTFGS
jgi:hypothetical protein